LYFRVGLIVGRFSKNILSVITGLFLMTGTAAAAPVVIDFTGAVDFFNPGPFTQNVALGGQITLDDTVVATGPNNTFNNVIIGLSLTIAEPGGPVVYSNNGTGGRVSQFSSADGLTEFVSVAFGGGAGGAFNASAGAPQITSFNIDFRGADLFGDPLVLATGLTEIDFSFSRANFNFNVGGVNSLMVERVLDTVTFSGNPQTAAIPAPGAALILGFGLIGVSMASRGRRS
jgi:hypothetical protein